MKSTPSNFPLSQLLIDLGKHTMPTIREKYKQGAYQGASEGMTIADYMRSLLDNSL